MQYRYSVLTLYSSRRKKNIISASFATVLVLESIRFWHFSVMQCTVVQMNSPCNCVTLHKYVQMDTITQEQAFPFPKNEKKNYCTSTFLQHQISVRLRPRKRKEKLTIYAQRLPIIINYLSIPIQRQSELAKFQNGQYRSHSCHRVYQQMQTYESFFFPRDIV